MMELNEEKTRNLSVAEYYMVIQKEYLIAEFRRKIYYSPKDKRYYTRVMDWKKSKIQEISERNHLESIFTSADLLKKMRKTLFNDNGKPIFEMTFDDIKNYFCEENEFSYNGNIWILKEKRGNRAIIYSKITDETLETDIENICRIL